ncbi:hypothetical protein B0T14DRAFT_520599 [Immersiella caudata]|uniref:Uncharacterized protein n=1 Tax=Immersiella caudata TaxID=314043 RepID=A0AA40C022_9PEZI|nr:hypothetical protein B0T14DRAFT_520599 [Immersiella caudata]
MWPGKGPTNLGTISKYYSQRKRRLRLMTCDTSFMEEGLPDISDAVWEGLWASHPGANRFIAIKPIGDHEVYAEVFVDGRSVGGAIMEPPDIIRARGQEAETNQVAGTSSDAPKECDDGSEDREEDRDRERDDEEDDGAGEGGLPTLPAPVTMPRARPLNAAQRRNRDTDPDSHYHRVATVVQPELVIVIPRQARSGRQSQTEASRLAEGVIEVVGIEYSIVKAKCMFPHRKSTRGTTGLPALRALLLITPNLVISTSFAFLEFKARAVAIG